MKKTAGYGKHIARLKLAQNKAYDGFSVILNALFQLQFTRHIWSLFGSYSEPGPDLHRADTHMEKENFTLGIREISPSDADSKLISVKYCLV